jgi:hypothetical protein
VGKYLDLLSDTTYDRNDHNDKIDKSNTYGTTEAIAPYDRSPPGKTGSTFRRTLVGASVVANPLENSLNRLSRFGRTFIDIEKRCPNHIEPFRWCLAIEDGRRFLARWGDQAEALGWTWGDLFGLEEVPTEVHPNYRRLGRYDQTGLIWLLQGCPVIALTEATAAIRMPTGSIVTYRRHNKPAFGPLGDSIDDFK